MTTLRLFISLPDIADISLFQILLGFLMEIITFISSKCSCSGIIDIEFTLDSWGISSPNNGRMLDDFSWQNETDRDERIIKNIASCLQFILSLVLIIYKDMFKNFSLNLLSKELKIR